MTDRFTLVYLEDPDHSPTISAAYDIVTGMFAPHLSKWCVDDLNSDHASVTDWDWDPASEWKIANEVTVSDNVRYSFSDSLISDVQTEWDSAIDRPKDFSGLPEDMQRAVLGTVSRILDNMKSTD